MYRISEINKFPKTNGIYKIYFNDCKSKKIYVGSASGKDGFYGRWKSHSSQLLNNKSGCKALQSAFNKYFNNDNLIFEIIEECDTKECLIREQYYIDNLDSYNKGYNTRPNASNNGGIKMKENTKYLIYKTWKKERDKLSPDIIKLYNSGKTTREICSILNISRTFLKRIFVENNIIPRNDRGLKRKNIFQYSLDGNFINEWESINKCYRELKISSHGISLVLNGKCSQHKNYYFNYNKISKEEVINIQIDFKNKLKDKNIKYRNIKQILDNKVIKEWDNTVDIINYLNINHKTNLYNALNNNTPYKGYYWKL